MATLLRHNLYTIEVKYLKLMTFDKCTHDKCTHPQTSIPKKCTFSSPRKFLDAPFAVNLSNSSTPGNH